MKNKHKFKYSKERVVLSDVLPYETPLTFSNRFYYRYLQNHSKSIVSEGGKSVSDIFFEMKKDTIPFKFRISHKNGEFRELNVIHPLNQKKVVEFYSKYKHLIIYYASLSPFSIRKPSKVSKYVYIKDSLHRRKKEENEIDNVEQDGYEYESLRSFFSYDKYNNIHKFYESDEFHSSEKKYDRLLKLDIEKCFDSIYTHTLPWAIFNKKIVKDNIGDIHTTFGGEFDKLMQQLNANETNGIVIGPEFSRIFAEVILQRIDTDLFTSLLNPKKGELPLIHHQDYEIYRYVDDYFIFYNSELVKDRIVKNLRLCLSEYKLHLNESKKEAYIKPIVTGISIAKHKISLLFNDSLLMKQKDFKDEKQRPLHQLVYYSSTNTITKFKTIIKESNVEYKDVMNYSLAILDRKTSDLIKEFEALSDSDDKEKLEIEFQTGFMELLDVSFFLYSVSPKVNSTIKICALVNNLILFVNKYKTIDFKFSFRLKHALHLKVYNEINLVISKNKMLEETPVETLYLILVLNNLGREYRLSCDLLASYFGFESDSKNGYILSKELNYFSITVLLFYIKDIKEYKPFLSVVKAYLIERFRTVNNIDWNRDTELLLLFMDVLTCPYLNDKVSEHRKNKVKEAIELKKGAKKINRYKKELKDEKYSFKKEILKELGIVKDQILIIEYEKFWFTKWTNFDFKLELESKKGQEVY